MPANRVPDYAINLQNPDGSTNITWWRYWAAIAGQFSGVDAPLPTPPPPPPPPPAAAIPSALKFAQSWAAQTVVALAHGFGTLAVLVQAFDAAGNAVIPQDVAITSANVVTLTFAAAFTGSAVVIAYGTAPVASYQYSTTWVAQAAVAVTHNLGTTNVIVAVYDAAGNQVIPQGITINSSNALSLTFAAPFSGSVVVFALPTRVNGFAASWAAQTSVTITHNLNTLEVIVQAYDAAGNQVIPENIALTDANDVTLTFAAAFTGSAVVMG